MTEEEIEAKLREMKGRVQVGGPSHQEIMRNFILEKLEEMGYVPTEQLYDRGGGLDDCMVYRGTYTPKGTGESVQAAAKITTNVSLGSILNPNAISYTELKAREMQTWRQLNHPNIPGFIASETFPFGFGNMDILLTDFIDAPTIREKIRKKEPLSEKELRTVLTGVLPALNHVHTELDTPAVVRDVHPGNILLNSRAYLTDFGLVRPVQGKKTNVTHIENGGYLPIDAIGEDPMPHHDIASLGNVVIAGVMGQEIGNVRTKQGLGGLDVVRVGDLPVSKQYREFIGKMIADPRNRFQSAKEALVGLERIVGLPVQVVPKPETQNQVVRRIEGLPEVVENGDGTLTIRGINPLRDFKIEGSVYQTAKAIKNSWSMVYDEGKTEIVGDINNSQKSRALLAYLQHAAQEHPVLQEVIDGKKTLEDAVREKKPDVLSTFSYLFSREVEKHDLKLFLKYIRHSAALLRETEGNKATFDERRKDLYGVLGMNERNFSIRGNLGKAVLGEFVLGVASPFAYVAQTSPTNVGTMATLFGGALFGLLSGGYLGIQHEKRKLLKQAREMDSWIREARVSQGLEKRIEKVELIGLEKNKILMKSALYPMIPAIGVSLLAGYSLNQYLGNLVLEGVVEPVAVIAGHLVPTMAVYTGGFFGLNKYLTSRALKKRRLAAGLPADEEKPSDIRVIGEREARRIEQEQKPEFLEGKLGKYVNEEIQAKYGKFSVINTVGYKKFSRTVKGSTPFYVVAVNEVLRNNGINLRTANQAELEKALREGSLNLKGHYEDSGLILRSGEEPNSYLAQKLLKQQRKLGFSEGRLPYPLMIPLTELELRDDGNSEYGLAFDLMEGGNVILADILSEYNNKRTFSKTDRGTGLPSEVDDYYKSKYGSGEGRTLYTRNSGLSRLCLYRSLDLGSGDDVLAYSSDDGRVVSCFRCRRHRSENFCW